MKRKTMMKNLPAALCACAAVMIAAYCSNPDINNPQYAFHTLTANAGTGGGVSSVPAAGKVRNGTSVTVKATPKNGYTFGSWTAGSGRLPSGVTADNPEAAFRISGDVSITAGFKLIPYTITYALNGGTVSTANPTGYNIETAAFKLNNPARTGYTFKGWTGANGMTPQTSVTVAKGNTGNKNYTANWTPANYTISYKLDGGTVATANPASYNIETATFTLRNPTRTGYVFAGWTSSNDTIPRAAVTVERGSTGNKSYTAKWTPTYTVTFLNHDNTVLKRDTVGRGSAATAPDNPARTGYTFTDWDKAFDNVTGNLTVTARYDVIKYTVTFVDYDDTVLKRDTVSHGSAATAPRDPARVGYLFTDWDKAFHNVTSNLTVTARYEVIKYTVTFLDHDETVLKRDTVSHGSAATAPGAPARTGYTFTGWDKTFDNVTVNLSVTARYDVAKYTVTFVDHDNTVLKRDTVNHGSAATAPGDPARVGYTFTGWDKAFNNVIGNLTVTATWMLIAYDIEYILNGGIQANNPPTSYNITSSTITLPTPTKSGYTFDGWYNNEELTGTIVTSIPTGSTGDRKFWAEWEKSCASGSFDPITHLCDERDNKRYKFVTIRTQTWMAENLNYNASGSACYNNSADSCAKYGRLYNWSTAMAGGTSSTTVPSGRRGVCPAGWHVPSDAEWDVLMTAVGGSSTAGRKLKSQTGWNSCGPSSSSYVCEDAHGFSALPGGYGRSSGGFYDAGSNGGWWSATEGGASHAWLRYMHYLYEYVSRGSHDKTYLFSARCLRD